MLEIMATTAEIQNILVITVITHQHFIKKIKYIELMFFLNESFNMLCRNHYNQTFCVQEHMCIFYVRLWKSVLIANRKVMADMQ